MANVPGKQLTPAPPSIDWRGYAEREAAAIIAEATPNTAHEGYAELVRLVALGWLQGVNFGEHRTLGHAEQAFDRLRAAL